MIGRASWTSVTWHFRPDETLPATGGLAADKLARLAASWRHLSVEVNDARAG